MVEYWEGTEYADTAETDTMFCATCGENVPVIDGSVYCLSDDCPFEHEYPDDFDEMYGGAEE